jgi:hypothetical protein
MSCSALLAGAAALAAAAVAVPAIAENLADHQMTLRLPGGGTETIHYTGRIAPEVHFDANPFLSRGRSVLSFGPSFAPWDDVSFDMARQMAAVLRRADMLLRMPGPPGLDSAGLTALPPGTSSYSVVSRGFGGNVCTHMMQIIAPRHGGKPRVVTRTSGQCGTDGSVAREPAGPNSGSRTIAAHAMLPVETAPGQTL